jgi:hypothetical protein
MNRKTSAWLATLLIAPPPSPAPPARQEQAEAILAAIVEADAAAMEANDLATMGVIGHDRYERLAQARDAAIDRASEWLRW